MDLTTAHCPCANHTLDGDAVSPSETLEVCPLCLSRYEAADEAICSSCEAPSCPDCAERLPSSGELLCYACPVPTKH